MLEEEFNKWLMDNVTDKIRDKIADIQTLLKIERGESVNPTSLYRVREKLKSEGEL